MIAITPTQRAALVTYLETLREWNEMLNLTAIKDPAQMVTKHVLDALTYLPFWATPPRRLPCWPTTWPSVASAFRRAA